ncbi:carbohydrate ABC transporter permease [Cohnella sp. REN36]|uniref:carbohydrate ABC transporter permease n=1 Tax=Cohnella sp. REN36 TaxID=2887347 RepID=UPI001D134D60|nr:carbohydrate ABC transporter permease [Cohnella sp. REN36]MCC3374188.1 carbohydrate ABC transporter permease [Cohnella sp. REN36]
MASTSERKTAAPGRLLGFIVLLVLSIVMLMPALFMISTSFKSNAELLLFPPTLIPKDIRFDNYTTIFEKMELLLYYKNSLLVSGFIVIGTLLSSSYIAFGFVRYRAPGRNALFMILVATLMIPYPATMIPQFVLFKNLGWVDSYLPLIVPAFFGSAYMIFLLRQFFSNLTDELFEAARIDGCSEFRSFWNIALPLCGPALATVAIFSFLWSWDDLLGPVIYLNSNDKYTLPIALAGLSSKFRVVPWNTLMVAAIYTVLPCIALFSFCQKYFVEGISLTGTKS